MKPSEEVFMIYTPKLPVTGNRLAVGMANAIWEEKIRRLMQDFEADYRQATCLPFKILKSLL